MNWMNAYPEDIFPEPDKDDFLKAHKILEENGLSLSRISVSNMRHVLKGIERYIIQILNENPDMDGGD